jgi:trigger factor/foldase protein PrsA
MEEDMRELTKRTAAAALAGIVAAGMFAGCGEKKLDGSQTVATVDGVEIPLGVLSLAVRQQQAQTAALYLSFFGTDDSIWDTVADEDTGETYGDQAVEGMLEEIELMYIMKAKAADYDAELTEDDETAIADAAAAFMEANSEETIEELSVTEDHVKTYLELQTYYERIYNALYDEAVVEISDEEANQSSFSYVKISTSDEDLTEDDIAALKEDAQAILDAMKEDPEADMDEVAESINEDYNGYSGTFTTYKSEDEEESSSTYPEEVLDVLREMEDGEVAEDVIETDSAYYVVRLDEILDEDATESKRSSLESSQRSQYFSDTTAQWLEDAEISVETKVLETLTLTDSHKFSLVTPTPTPEPETTDDETTEETTDETTDETSDDEAEADTDEEMIEDDDADADADIEEETSDDEASEDAGADSEEE